ncbi:DUF3717 domain-containing protein (plasmid) [Paraburkholderia sp. DD10]|uniref:DUF3717 domain-containing protein n=1 Tax=Paraburkholderia sp. DD10 TaxID=3409691 RepID=UPI003BA35654
MSADAAAQLIEQGVISLCGALAVFLSQDRRDRWRRWACIFGLAAQPFWFDMAWLGPSVRRARAVRRLRGVVGAGLQGALARSQGGPCMNFAISDIEAAIRGWRMRSPSDEAFAASAEARALARLYGAVIVHGCEGSTDAELDDAQRDALRILSTHPPGALPQ